MFESSCNIIVVLSLFALFHAQVLASARTPFKLSNFPSTRTLAVSRTLEQCGTINFRSLSGRCTSTANPTSGEAHQPLFSYFDTNSITPSPKNLSSARRISNIVCHQNEDTKNSMKLNELFTFFGQFIDHDFALSPISTPPEHLEIPIPSDDPILKKSHLEFTRSRRVNVGASVHIERPINVVSSALDLSTVYGVENDRNSFLRATDSCRLKTSTNNMLPLNTEGLPNLPNTSPNFFVAGDTRANETPMLTAMHTIWVRQHNHICSLLEDAFPNFSSERQYESARALNIALYQKTIYEEWLPAILGSKLPPYKGYSGIDPTVSIEFSTAGFRLGHTLVGNDVSRIDQFGDKLPSIPAARMFFMPSSQMDAEEMEDIIRGARSSSAQEVDELVVDSLRNFLFDNVPEEEGFDLIALNLQRGRDHNLVSFNDLRQAFVGARATSFAQISSKKETREKLERAYESVDDVEAWIGLVAEDKEDGVGLGRTLAALWRTEFLSLRDGDQFFYMNRRGFEVEVLDGLPEIREELFGDKMVFNSILRRTTDVDAVLPRSERNAFVL